MHVSRRVESIEVGSRSRRPHARNRSGEALVLSVAAQSIPLNIAEGNGKRSLKHRARFLNVARGSALECTALQDTLLTTKGIKVQDDAAMKALLHRIVPMLTRMAMKFDGVAEPNAAYDAEFDYDHEHRCAEHEHEAQTEEAPEPWEATERKMAFRYFP